MRTLQGVSEEPIDDTSAWGAACEGDGAAFGLIFDRHHARVRRHAARLVVSAADVDDVAASAFLELWRRRASVRLVRGSVLPWLLVTTTNLARNAARSTRRYEAFLSRLPRPDDAPDVADGVLDRQADPRLVAGLRTLSATDRRLVALVVLDGLSLTDAAEAVGVSVPAAKSRLHRARARLRAALPQPTLEEVTP